LEALLWKELLEPLFGMDNGELGFSSSCAYSCMGCVSCKGGGMVGDNGGENAGGGGGDSGGGGDCGGAARLADAVVVCRQTHTACKPLSVCRERQPI
jgi:hypothetical protein